LALFVESLQRTGSYRRHSGHAANSSGASIRRF
jgi:hypothetical protein